MFKKGMKLVSDILGNHELSEKGTNKANEAIVDEALYGYYADTADEKAKIAPELYRGAIGGRVLPADALIGIKGLQVFSQMRVDDQIKSAMLLKKYAVLAGEWTIQPASEEQEDIEKAEFIKFCFEQMDGSLKQALLPILTGLDYGYSISEENWKLTKISPFANKIILKNIKTKHPIDFEFEVDEFGNILPNGLIQKSTQINLPINKFIHFINNSDFGNVYGTSDLRAAHKAWFSKSIITKAWGIYLERFAMPTPVVMYNQRAKQAQQSVLQTIMDRLQFKSSIIIPKDLIEELNFLETTGRGGDIFEQAVSYFDRSIVKSLLVPDQMGIGGKENTGSFAKAKTQFNVFMLAIDKIKADLAESVLKEQIIKRLIDFNFSETKAYPEFVWLPLEEANKQEIAKIWIDATMNGVVSQDLEDINTLRQLLGFPEKKTDSIKKPEIPNNTPKQPEDVKQPKDVEKPPTDQIAAESVTQDLVMSAEKFTLSRKLTKYESKENFVQMDKEMQDNENRMLTSIRGVLEKQRDDLVHVVTNRQRKNELNLPFITNLTIRFNNELRSILKGELTNVYNGARRLSKKIFKFQVSLLEPLPPQKALQFFKSKAFYITGLIDEDLKRQSKSILFNAMKQGWGVKETSKALLEMYEPYLGNEAKLKDNKLLTPFRLETIVRTNVNEAINQGRKDEFQSAVDDGFITAYQYSSILDDRTTEVCRFLDQKILNPKDSRTDRLIPPNHFNCRSVIVPITKDEGPVNFISESEIGKALELKDNKF